MPMPMPKSQKPFLHNGMPLREGPAIALGPILQPIVPVAKVLLEAPLQLFPEDRIEDTILD